MRTKEEIQDRIKVMQAWVDGKEVEAVGGSGWFTALDPSFDWTITSYRIKPKPRELLLVDISTPESMTNPIWAEATSRDTDGILFREVLDNE